jgi:hypothetical protein
MVSLVPAAALGALFAVASAVWASGGALADAVGPEEADVWAAAVDEELFADYGDAARVALVGAAEMVRAGRAEMIPAALALGQGLRLDGEEEEARLDLLGVEMPIDAVDALAALAGALKAVGAWEELDEDTRAMLACQHAADGGFNPQIE